MIALLKRVEFQHDIQDARIARLSALIANVNSKDKKFSPEDFMPQKPGRKDEEKVLTPEETAEYFKNFAIEQGGVVLDNEGNLLEGDPAKVGLPPHAN